MLYCDWNGWKWKNNSDESTLDEISLNDKRISSFMTYNDKNTYIVNLDPAVASLPYVPNIDIRDTVDYKGVMKEYTIACNVVMF